MNYLMNVNHGFLLIEVEGPLSSKDFEEMSLVVDPWIESHDFLKGIVIHAKKFPGWENLGSFFRHMIFVKNHHKKVKKVALVMGGEIAEIAVKIAEHFVQADVKHFDGNRIDQAIDWVLKDDPKGDHNHSKKAIQL